MYRRVALEPQAPTAPLAPGSDGTEGKPTRRAWTWAALMHRASGIDVLAGPHCGGRLRLIAALHDPAVIRTILAHWGWLPPGRAPAPPHPARRRHALIGFGVRRPPRGAMSAVRLTAAVCLA